MFMKQKTYIQIPTVCEENWNEMTPVEQGRFCKLCSKEVVDFSTMSDSAVLNYLKSNKGNLCGRFYEDQLQRPLQETVVNRKSSWKIIFASIGSLLLLIKSNAQKTILKKEKQQIDRSTKMPTMLLGEITVDTNERAAQKNKSVTVIQSTQNNLITGNVTDEKNNPIAFASVFIDNTTSSTLTDVNGNFKLRANALNNTDTIKVMAVGYETKELSGLLDDTSHLSIQLKSKVNILPEVAVVAFPVIKGKMVLGGICAGTKAVNKTDSISSLFSKIFHDEPFKVFPNPAQKGGSVSIIVNDAGNYLLQLVSNQAQLIQTQELAVSYKEQLAQMQVPSGIAAGMYYVRLVNVATRKQLNTKIIVR